jgi:hypothetical protein
MDKIYAKGNYLVIEQSGISYFFAQNTSVFFINNTDIIISTVSRINVGRTVTIAARNISSFYDESGRTPYNYTTLIELLTTYTSKF